MNNISDKFTRISQVGFVVKDMDKVVNEMRRIFGVEPKYGKLPDKGKQYKGKDAEFDAILAFYNFANIELEFIQPIRGQNIWQDFLDSGREGIHHIRFSVDNFDEVVGKMNEKEIPVIMEGKSTRNIEGLRWGYFDSDKALSFIFEIFNEDEVCKE